MKLCIAIDGVSNSGGTDRVVSLISSLFANQNIDTTVISLSAGEPYYAFNNKVELKRFSSKIRFVSLLKSCFFIKKEKFDFVIVLSMGRLSAQLIPMLKLFNIQSKIICNDHVSIKSFKKIIQWIKYPAYKIADAVVVLTNADKKYLSNKIGDKVYVVRNISPYEDVSFKKNLQGNGKKIALAVGRLTYQKNFQRLIRLWGQAETKDWDLYIVGDGNEKEEIEELIKRVSKGNVFIKPPSKEINYWYESASLLLMTSRYEGLPMVLIEAKNFGLPVISFDCETGPSEIITNDGYLIEYSNDSEFVNKLNMLLLDKNQRDDLSENALINSREFTKEKILYEWLKVLN